jgi:hypothetical protein
VVHSRICVLIARMRSSSRGVAHLRKQRLRVVHPRDDWTWSRVVVFGEIHVKGRITDAIVRDRSLLLHEVWRYQSKRNVYVNCVNLTLRLLFCIPARVWGIT